MPPPQLGKFNKYNLNMSNSKEAPHIDFVHRTRSIPNGESFTIVDYVEAVANIAALT